MNDRGYLDLDGKRRISERGDAEKREGGKWPGTMCQRPFDRSVDDCEETIF